MGLVHAEITLRNAFDELNARRGKIIDSEVRQMTLTAMVDTGAWTLVINEAVRQELGLEIVRSRRSEFADGEAQNYSVTEPVSIQWNNRDTICQAVVLPNSSEVLLGAIPLEGMDLVVNPLKQELTGAHGDEALYSLK